MVVGLAVIAAGCRPLGVKTIVENMGIVGYMVGLGMTWSIGYPLGQTAVLSLFSKVLGGLPMGGFLGVFSTSGCAARIVFAMVAGKMWNEFGMESVFIGIVGYVMVALAMLGVYFGRRRVRFDLN